MEDEQTLGIKALEAEQKKKLVDDINARKTTALNEITPLEQQTKQTAIANRQNQNVQSQVNKLNFAEFLANRGQVSSGIGGQAELSRQNVLARGIGDINQAEQTQLNQYGTQRANINTAFNQDLTSGTQAIALDTASKLLAYKDQLRQEKQAQAEQLRREQLQQQEQLRQEALQQAEQLRREQVARDEATLAYKRSNKGGGTTETTSRYVLDKNGNLIDTVTGQIVSIGTPPGTTTGTTTQQTTQKSVVQKYTPQVVKQELSQLVASGQMPQAEANKIIRNDLLTKGIFKR